MQDLLVVGSAPTGSKDLEITLDIDARSAIVGSAPTGVKDLETTLDVDARSAHTEAKEYTGDQVGQPSTDRFTNKLSDTAPSGFNSNFS